MTRPILVLLSLIMVASGAAVSSSQGAERATASESSGFSLSREVPAGYYRKHRHNVRKHIYKHHRKHYRKCHRRHWH
jgi:hypothetical protein